MPALGGDLRPSARPVVRRQQVPVQATAAEPTVDQGVIDEKWRRRGLDAAAQQRWLAAGLRADDAALADQCSVEGITPDMLSRKLSGQTALARLRGGESATSVWARIREAGEAPPKRGTRLTGRFSQVG